MESHVERSFLDLRPRMPPGFTSAPNRHTYKYKNGYRIILDYNEFSSNYGWEQFEHIIVAEKMLGQNLPKGYVVHHLDGNKVNNTPCNLIICESHREHRLIHQRQRAYEACGHIDWVMCFRCKGWSDPKFMWKTSGRSVHPHCQVKRKKSTRRLLLGLDS